MPDSFIPGLHHVTALSGAAQATLDFYAGVLGLRRVKTTVNFDDPKTHHLYYGDTVGRPGTVITFFPWPKARSGRVGAGMVTAVAFAVPPDTLDDWAAHLDDADVTTTPFERFGESGLQFEAPAGLSLELVATDRVDNAGAWSDGPVPDDRAIRGFHAPTLPVFSDDSTPDLLRGVFGWTQVDEQEDRLRFRAPEARLADRIDLLVRDRHPSGRIGTGTVHHVAFRARDADEQRRWQQALRDYGIQVTDVKNRQYFQSIYFRDPNWTSGILFEIATDGPGFLEDESEAELGASLRLPHWLESRREEIEANLPSLTPPALERS
jgi:glyoxalase family protein